MTADLPKKWNPARLRRIGTWLAIAVTVAGLSCMFLPGSSGHIRPPSQPLVEKAIQTEKIAIQVPEPAVFQFQPVEPQKAFELNAEVPVFAGPNPAAKPFRFDLAATSALGRLTATDCLTAAIYYEAASESEAGQRAVAQVVLNRVRHPAYPKSVCDVVFQGSERTTGCQFTFACDGALARIPAPGLWAQARRYAEQALSGFVVRQVGLATHYHTVWVVPYWRSELTKVAVVGAHIFYRWQGGWGTPSAFTGRYSAEEVQPLKLAPLQNLLLSWEASNMPPMALPVDTALLAQAVRPKEADKPSPLPAKRTLAVDTAKPTLVADEKHGVLLKN